MRIRETGTIHQPSQAVPAKQRGAALLGRATCSIEEAAAFLEVGRSTAYAAARDGSLPVLRISHRLLVSVPRLLALVGVDEGSSAPCEGGDAHS